MKKTIKLYCMVMMLAVLGMGILTGCGGNTQESEQTAQTNETMKVGIIQFMPHSSLDNCTQGVKNALDAQGIAYDVQIGSSSSAADDCQNYAANMVASGDYDMLIAVATPAATAAYSAVRSASSDIPVIFCAVSAPEEAGLVQSLETPGNNCTGTKDVFDIPSQVAMIQALQPELTQLGVLYTTSEANSLAQLETLKEECAKVGIEVVEAGITDATELPAAVASLLPNVQAVTNLTDNNVVDNMSTLLEQAAAKQIPVYGSEIEQCLKGCIAAASIDYVALGETTGNMAINVLNGADAATTSVVEVLESTPVINTDVLSAYGITLPEAYADAEMVTTTAAE